MLPDLSDKKTYKFAFLVHPRNSNDVYRKYPALRVLPKKMMGFLLRWYWPVILSKVTGLKSQKSGKEIEGFVLTIPLTADQMLKNRKLTLRKIIKAVNLAKKNGAKIIGLGGLTSSLSKGGLEILSKVHNINITTGHAYTTYNVTQTFFSIANIFGVNKSKVLIAIVGAAGSVGSTSSKIIAREGYTNILLVDLERKKEHLLSLVSDLKSINSEINIIISHQIKDIRNADFIVTATNTPEALIKSEDVKSGAVVVDDAQPSDVSSEVLKRSDVLVLEAGVVHTPGVLNHFNFNLKDKYDNFCCMAEVLVLASLEHNDHYVINRASLNHVDQISRAGSVLGFRVAEFQNFNESITHDKIAAVRQIATKSWI
jgi:fatty aldehyde-generating acyl-ACP reductase